MSLRAARSKTDAMVESIGTLVSCESPTADLDACRRICDVALSVLNTWLPEPGRVEVHSGRPVVRWGDAQPKILFLGHLDTVWPLSTLDRIPWQVADGQMRGPGVFDMKAGVVIAIAALAALADPSQVGLLLTTDEETGSHASRGVIAAAITNAKAVFVFEPAAGSAYKTRRKGTSWYDITFTGRAAHAGLDPHKGVNALIEAALFTSDAAMWGNPPEQTTVTPTMLIAGTTSNTVPATAKLTLDVRAWNVDEQTRVDEAVREWKPWNSEAGMTIAGGIDRAALESHASADLFASAQVIAHDLGLPPLTEASVGGASDGNLTAAAGIPTLDGMGAVGDGAHADHEWACVAELAPRVAIAAELAAHILRD